MKPTVVLLPEGQIQVDGVIYEHLSQIEDVAERTAVEQIIAQTLAGTPSPNQPLYPVRRWLFFGLGSIGFFFVLIPFWLLPADVAFAYMTISLSAGFVGFLGGLLTRRLVPNQSFTFQLSVLMAFISFAIGWFGMFTLFNSMS